MSCQVLVPRVSGVLPTGSTEYRSTRSTSSADYVLDSSILFWVTSARDWNAQQQQYFIINVLTSTMTSNNGPRAKCDQVVFEALAKAAEIIVQSRCLISKGKNASSGRFNLQIPEQEDLRYAWLCCAVLCMLWAVCLCCFMSCNALSLRQSSSLC